MLVATDLRKSFNGTFAVDNVSLELGRGESVGLLGPNGAGKSTTIAMLSTLTRPDAGKVEFEGQDVLADPAPVRRAMGVVPQEIALYPELTAQENLEFFGGLYGLRGEALRAAIDDALDLVGLSERRRDQIKKYSGGMKRRINIAAALLHDPKIVIMDEPTVGIDPQSRNHILDTVRRLNRERGLTVLYTSHYMEEVEQLCDRVYVMDHGKVIAQGTLDDVRALAGDEGAVWLQATAYPDGLLESLRALPGAGQAALADDGIRLTRTSELALIDVLRAAEKAGVTVTNLSVSESSLEDVFLHLTGRKLRD
ncbi:MAG: ABC transporter ATP-binding protein [Trueperaceae bacterium]